MSQDYEHKPKCLTQWTVLIQDRSRKEVIMRFQHTKCGGEIDVKKRQCTKCKYRWNPISFRLDPIGIRPMVDKKGRPLLGGEDVKKLKKKYAPWADKVPGAGRFAGLLPAWPRWARILATVAFLLIVAFIVFLIIQ